jgi:O-glycosyl hydrolase
MAPVAAVPYAAPREERFRVWDPNEDGYLSEKQELVLGDGDAARAVELLVEALPRPEDGRSSARS